MKTDIEIAQECTMEPITEIAKKAGIADEYLEQYGKYKAKIDYNLLKQSDRKDGKLVLVTAINPTPAGEGKTTTTVGLADAMQRLDKKVMVALREPSLGPVFGVKGGAAGGGYAQVVPMEDINLHFTGDFHAIGAANNLLAAMLDNHIYQGNELNIDPRKIVQETSCTVVLCEMINPSEDTPSSTSMANAIPNTIPAAPSREFIIFRNPEIKSLCRRSRIPFVIPSALINNITIPIIIRSGCSPIPTRTINIMITSDRNARIVL